MPADIVREGVSIMKNLLVVVILLLLSNVTVFSQDDSLVWQAVPGTGGYTVTGFSGTPPKQSVDDWKKGLPGQLVIPNEIDGQKIIGIGKDALNQKLNSFLALIHGLEIIIPKTVVTISEGAFVDPYLVYVYGTFKVKFPDKVYLTIDIGRNVSITGDAFVFDFAKYYNSTGKKAGKYKYQNDVWTFAPN